MAEREEKEEKGPDQPKGDISPNSHITKGSSVKKQYAGSIFKGRLKETRDCGSVCDLSGSMWITDLRGSVSVSEWRQHSEGHLTVKEAKSGTQELCGGGQELQALGTSSIPVARG